MLSFTSSDERAQISRKILSQNESSENGGARVAADEREVELNHLESESADEFQQRPLEYETRSSKLWVSLCAKCCGPAFLFLTVGTVLGAMLSSTSNTATQDNVEWAQRWAFEHKCDQYLAKYIKGERQTTEETCIDHEKISNFASSVQGESLAFVVIGDWGRDGWCCQKDVAVEMGKSAKKTGASFVMNVGDNFYPLGISTGKDEQITSSWINIYNTDGIKDLTWYNALGNHDWYGNYEADLEMAKLFPKWYLPSRYYAKTFQTEAKGVTVHAVFLDTTPLLQFYSESTPSIKKFHEEVATASKYMDEQIAFLRKEFSNSTATWRVVVGHHPVYTSSDHYNEDHVLLRTALRPVLEELKVVAYFNGHDHGLEYHRPNPSALGYVLSGAGSQVRPGMQIIDEGLKFHYSSNGGYVSVSANTTIFQVQYLDFRGVMLFETLLDPITA